MSDNVPTILSDYLTKHYGSLKLRLAQLLRSGDLADDALQDTWLRVNSKPDGDDPIHSPAGYLLRIAVNIAVDNRRRQSRFLPLDEIAELMDAADPAPGPERVVNDRFRVEALSKLIDLLPGRQRQVVILVHLEGLEQKEVAKRLGLSLRTIESDLKKAHDYLMARKNE